MGRPSDPPHNVPPERSAFRLSPAPPPRRPRAHLLARSAPFATLALLVLACTPAPKPPPLVDLLGKQTTVSLGHCVLHEGPAGISDVQCPRANVGVFIPIIGLAALSLFYAHRVLARRGGYRRSAGDTVLGIVLGLPGIGLCYAGYLGLQEHTFTFHRPQQTLAHEARIPGLVLKSGTLPVSVARCSLEYEGRSKNRSAGWKIVLRPDGVEEHTIGRLTQKADAEAVCRYLLPPTTDVAR